MANLIDRSRIFYKELMTDAMDFAKSAYGQSENQFSPSSAWGQLLLAINRIAQYIFFYIEDLATEQNIFTASRANSLRDKVAQTGYNVSRAISARGEVVLVPTGSYSSGIDNIVKILNYTELKCTENDLSYVLTLNQDYLAIDTIQNNNDITFNIIQGNLLTQVFTGNGQPLQTITIFPGVNQSIDEFFFMVTVNGQLWKKKESFYDMPFRSNTYLAKTSLTGGGIDIIFGDVYYGEIPQYGSEIQVQYLVSAGKDGNVFIDDLFTFKFQSLGEDNLGNTLDLNDVFTIRYNQNIGMGSNAEDIKLTRYLAPKVSRSFVLATAENYKNYFEKFNYFSIIDVFPSSQKDPITNSGRVINNNELLVYLIVDPNFRKSVAETYFDIPVSGFYLSEYEQMQILQALEDSGQKLISSVITFITPKIKKYVMEISVQIWEGSNPETVRNKMITMVSNYMLSNKRRNKIPKSDFISLFESIEEIDSVSLYFISEDIESELNKLLNADKYLTSVVLQNESFPSNYKTMTITRKLEFIFSTTKFSDFFYKHLDKHGDIIMTENEIAILRGGFYARDNKYYQDTIDSTQTNIVNINFAFSSKRDLEIINTKSNTKLLREF